MPVSHLRRVVQARSRPVRSEELLRRNGSDTGKTAKGTRQFHHLANVIR